MLGTRGLPLERNSAKCTPTGLSSCVYSFSASRDLPSQVTQTYWEEEGLTSPEDSLRAGGGLLSGEPTASLALSTKQASVSQQRAIV